MCPHIEISFNSITKRHNLKQTKVLRGQPVNSNQIFCPCQSFTYDYCLLFGVAGREVKAVRADGECTTRLMRHMQHVCLHFRLLLMRTDLHPTYILYMLELSLKRLDILLDCSKDHRQDIAPWLDWLPRDLCTYAKHRQSRGCPMDKGLSADSWPPEFSDFCLVCLPPLFFGFLLFACLGISPLFRLLVPPKLKLIWFLCAPSLTSGFLLIRWNCTCAGRFVLFGHPWNFR